MDHDRRSQRIIKISPGPLRERSADQPAHFRGRTTSGTRVAKQHCRTIEKLTEKVMRRRDPELLLASGTNGEPACRRSSYALSVTKVLTPIASRISWRRAMQTV